MGRFGTLVGRCLRIGIATTRARHNACSSYAPLRYAGAVRKSEQYRAMQTGYRDLQQQSDRSEGSDRDRADNPDPVATYPALAAYQCSQSDPLDLVLGEPLLRAIVELSCSRAFVRSHFLGVFERRR